ncbi:hypothetical protein HY357_03160 [Candidatus Roizmanbacteria bacterium]|nr:hypothetical protein [Candidatus Roizmanbacteria bacterium]
MKRRISLLVLFFLFFVSFSSVEARLLPRYRSGGKKVTAASSGLIVSPRLRADRRAILIFFSNLNKSKSLSYTLIYQTNGKDEGVGGSIDNASGNSANRELLFGTCSSGVCSYHSNITNMRLEITTELQNGKKTLRRFRIRV